MVIYQYELSFIIEKSSSTFTCWFNSLSSSIEAFVYISPWNLKIYVIFRVPTEFREWFLCLLFCGPSSDILTGGFLRVFSRGPSRLPKEIWGGEQAPPKSGILWVCVSCTSKAGSPVVRSIKSVRGSLTLSNSFFNTWGSTGSGTLSWSITHSASVTCSSKTPLQGWEGRVRGTVSILLVLCLKVFQIHKLCTFCNCYFWFYFHTLFSPLLSKWNYCALETWSSFHVDTWTPKILYKPGPICFNYNMKKSW